MSTAEILDQLPRLSPEERKQVQAKLDELAGCAPQNGGKSNDPGHRSAHIRSPRLADSIRCRDFRKQIVELSRDA
jgi:hypothetical protein